MLSSPNIQLQYTAKETPAHADTPALGFDKSSTRTGNGVGANSDKTAPSTSAPYFTSPQKEERTMNKLLGFIVIAYLLAPFSALALDTPVASIKTVRGTNSIIRNKTSLEAKMGSRVFQGDILKTGSDGNIAIVFRDDTLLSLGPNSEITITEFLFSPAEGKLSFITRLLRGTAACVTGIIGKLSPQSVRFETPVANIGIRGTRFAVMTEGSDN
jgi:hypothetical protein